MYSRRPRIKTISEGAPWEYNIINMEKSFLRSLQKGLSILLGPQQGVNKSRMWNPQLEFMTSLSYPCLLGVGERIPISVPI